MIRDITEKVLDSILINKIIRKKVFSKKKNRFEAFLDIK